ncbi:MAG: hypothetical protein ACJ8LG_24725 [Massilia sp.]
MSEQVLALHRVSRRCYDLAGVRTGSVRDQLLRSTMVVNALASEGLIGRGRALLVYGAGPAGMNAAMQAAAHHADVTVIERAAVKFSTISAAWWRRVDATEYDWPHNHWKAGVFPFRGTIPLMQTSTSSGLSLALGWDRAWQTFDQSRNGQFGSGKVNVIHNLDAAALHPTETPTLLDVRGRWTPGPAPDQTRSFGALLSCIGHGDEQVTEVPLHGHWHGYAGPGFWTHSDGIAAGKSLPEGVRNVVISGAGDGGMQDFQRVTTSRCGAELLALLGDVARDYEVHNAASNVPIYPTAPLEQWLLSADEAGRRAFSWAPGRHGAPAALMKWHGDFETQIEAFVQRWPPALATHVARCLFRREAFENQLAVRWVMREPTPGYAYALNRYLVILLKALADLVLPGRFTVYPSSAIGEIVPVNHTCHHAPDCIGKTHRVRIDTANMAPTPCLAELIIIRHGVEPRPLLLSGRLPVQEQISPFDLPG